MKGVTVAKVLLVGLVLIVGAIVGSQVYASAGPSEKEDEPNYPRVAPVPSSVVRDVSVYDIEIAPVADSETKVAALAPAVSAEEATDVVRANLGLDEKAIAGNASLAQVTTGQYGTELEKDPAKPSRIDPAIQKQLTWVITFSKAQMPILGKEGYEGPTVSEGPLLALVDPKSGEMLYAIGY